MRKEGSAIALARAYRRAIVAHCLECSGGCRKEVKACRVKGCALWAYRMGGDLIRPACGGPPSPKGKAFGDCTSADQGKAFGGGATAAEGKAGDDDTRQMSMMEMLTGG